MKSLILAVLLSLAVPEQQQFSDLCIAVTAVNAFGQEFGVRDGAYVTVVDRQTGGIVVFAERTDAETSSVCARLKYGDYDIHAYYPDELPYLDYICEDERRILDTNNEVQVIQCLFRLSLPTLWKGI